MILNRYYICPDLTVYGMSVFGINECNTAPDQDSSWLKSFNDQSDCVFKKCCEKYKKKGKHCKKCPKK